jgi:hypothetical protein
MKLEGNASSYENNAGKQYFMVLTSNLIEVSMIFQVHSPFRPLPPIPLPSPAVALIEKVRDAFRALPYGRKQSNARLYEMEDAATVGLRRVFLAKSVLPR